MHLNINSSRAARGAARQKRRCKYEEKKEIIMVI